MAAVKLKTERETGDGVAVGRNGSGRTVLKVVTGVAGVGVGVG